MWFHWSLNTSQYCRWLNWSVIFPKTWGGFFLLSGFYKNLSSSFFTPFLPLCSCHLPTSRMSPVLLPIYCLPKVPPSPALPGVEDTTPTCTRGCEGKQESSSQRFSITCLTWWPLSSSGVRNGFSRGSALVDNYLEVAVECRKGGRRGSCVSEAAEVAVVTVLGDTALKSRPNNLLAPLLKPPK